MVITLCGENAYARRQALRSLLAAFVQKHGPHAVEQCEATSVTPAALRSQVSAISLFAPQRLIILRQPSENKELYSALPEIIPNVPDGTTLVLVDGSLDKRTKTYKSLKAGKEFHEFVPLSDRQLLTWVQAQVAAKEAAISSEASHYLIERVGNDQWQLAGEIDKLVAFASEITKQTIDALVTPNLEVSAFALLDATLAGRTTDREQLFTQLQAHSDAYEFFGLLVWQVQALAVVSVAPKMPAAELARTSGLKPFVLQKSQGLVARLGVTRIKEIVAIIAEVDMQIKSTGIDPWLLVGQALTKISRE